ncbi:MAG: hypothetical protein ACP59X_18530 [Solidesulfovibrio sp. DCME]|uniref:hypothetical protein n=1 Tax=Solidesulfovibrio sp. DCME TaxID=3447380 RepID=UPI003D0D23E6
MDCSAYFETKDPDKSPDCGTFCHSWLIGDPVFALGLAMPLEGEIDRKVLPTREKTADGLKLKPDSRPPYQNKWKTERPTTP